MKKKNILFIDAYRPQEYRINKDVNGAYGTGNNYGGSKFTKLLAKYQKNSIFWPPIYFVSTLAVVKNLGHKGKYTTNHYDASKEFDLFILSSAIVSCETETSVIKLLRKYKKPILLIGPFASNNPDPYINAGANVLIGESDTALFAEPEIIDNLSLNPKKIIPQSNFVDINHLPIPDWETVFRHKKTVMGFLGSGSSIPISSSRGCPYSCFNYCTYPLQQGRKHRKETAKRVVDQIDYFQRKLNVNSFLFRDPVFTLNRQHVIELCEEISRRKINIVWGAELHLKDIDKELAKIMYKAGLRIVFVGIESINPESIKKAKRQSATTDIQLRGLNALEKAGISVKAMFIIGFPGDSYQNAIRTIKYACKLPVTYLQFSVFTPYPGTPIFEEYKDKIVANKFEEYTQWDLIFKHENLQNKDVKYLLTKAYSSFYTSIPKIIKIIYRLLKIEIRKRFGFL